METESKLPGMVLGVGFLLVLACSVAYSIAVSFTNNTNCDGGCQGLEYDTDTIALLSQNRFGYQTNFAQITLRTV